MTLVDINYYKYGKIEDMIAEINGNMLGTRHIDTGIYDIGHFSFYHLVESFHKIDEFPELGCIPF